MNIREEVIEFLILNQPYIKAQLEDLKAAKEKMIDTINPVFRQDLDEQYNVRISQWIAHYTGEALALPIEDVILVLERIDVEEFLNV